MNRVTQFERGLDLPLAGSPDQSIVDGPAVKHVALIGDDYIGLKPTMAVAKGDEVALGQLLFTDKKTPGVCFTAPAAGVVSAIHRGGKRKFESLVIEVADESHLSPGKAPQEETFAAYPDNNLAMLEYAVVRDQLLASGLWTALRTRPFSKIPSPDSVPHSLFVTAMDTSPLAASPAVVLADRATEFIAGLQVLSVLAEGYVYVCYQQGQEIPGRGKTPASYHPFAGPHPAGLVGTHIHSIDPVDADKSVWHIGYQDVVAVGHLFLTGKLFTERIVALGGPLIRQPRLLRTRLGASLRSLTAGQISTVQPQKAPIDQPQKAHFVSKPLDYSMPQKGVRTGEVDLRIISGSALSGRRSVAPIDFLGRYHTQVTVLAEGRQRELLGWLKPGGHKFSLLPIFASAWDHDPSRKIALDTSLGGSPRSIVPIGMYEEVMPLDLVATALLKALVTGDIEYAEQLGVLELDEEDLALCTFVCPSKITYGPLLRECLTRIEAEG